VEYRRAYEQDPKEVVQWLKTEYPEIRRKAKREHAEIHCGDEMELRSDHQAGRSYGRRGSTVRLQPDIDSHQPGPNGIYGIQEAVYCRRDDYVSPEVDSSSDDCDCFSCQPIVQN